MGQRARKKRRSEAGTPATAVRARASAPAGPASPAIEPAPEPARASASAGAQPAPAGEHAEPATSGAQGYYARQRARDDAARAALKPLAPGERPLAVTVAAVLAGLLAVGNLVLLALGWEVEGQRPQVTGTLIFAGLMGIGAVAMWRKRYWAVLGFQALLAITLLFASLALLTASNLQAVVLCVGIIAVSGPLFWFLVKAMARLQLPERPPTATR